MILACSRFAPKGLFCLVFRGQGKPRLNRVVPGFFIPKCRFPPEYRFHFNCSGSFHYRRSVRGYLPANAAGHEAFTECSRSVAEAEQRGEICLPDPRLEHGHNTRQVMGYG